MCGTCGCSEGHARLDGEVLAYQHAAVGEHDHAHCHEDPARSHADGIAASRMVRIEQDILAHNDAHAMQNRRWFARHGIFALNLISGPGAGKTTLLARTIEALQGRVQVAVIEGDQQTSNDAERIRATGAPAVQINTGKGCHLDAHMVGHALERLLPAPGSVVVIENVGNLVCPAAFDLGEAHKVAVLSVAEGEDKPLKYPDVFRAASVLLLNKIDLLPYLQFHAARCTDYARRVNPAIRIIEVSATRGDGIQEWVQWVEDGVRAARDAALARAQQRVTEARARPRNSACDRVASPPAGQGEGYEARAEKTA